MSGERVLRALPNLCFRWTAVQGANDLCRGYRRIGLERDEFEGRLYQRLAHLQWLIDSGLVKRDLRPTGTSANGLAD